MNRFVPVPESGPANAITAPLWPRGGIGAENLALLARDRLISNRFRVDMNTWNRSMALARAAIGPEAPRHVILGLNPQDGGIEDGAVLGRIWTNGDAIMGVHRNGYVDMLPIVLRVHPALCSDLFAKKPTSTHSWDDMPDGPFWAKQARSNIPVAWTPTLPGVAPAWAHLDWINPRNARVATDLTIGAMMWTGFATNRWPNHWMHVLIGRALGRDGQTGSVHLEWGEQWPSGSTPPGATPHTARAKAALRTWLNADDGPLAGLQGVRQANSDTPGDTVGDTFASLNISPLDYSAHSRLAMAKRFADKFGLSMF